MRFIPDEIEAYAERYTTAHPAVFDAIEAETRATQEGRAGMMVGRVEGAFLSFLVSLKQPRVVLEIGTFTGWSSIAMALALPTGGSVITCDVNEETTGLARRFARQAGVADRIDYRIGTGGEVLGELDGPFDLVFIDADKESYVDYYESVLPKLADGGVIAADNTLFGTETGDIARAIERFNDHVHRDRRVESVLLTIREGVTLIRRR